MALSADRLRPQLLDLENGQPPVSLPQGEDIIFSPGSKGVILLNCDHAVLDFWSNGPALHDTVALEGLSPGENLGSFGFSRASDRVFGIDQTGLIRCWETVTGKLCAKAQGPQPPIRCAVLGRQGKWLAVTTEAENSVRLYDLRAGSMKQLAGHRDFVAGLAFSPDGTMLASASMDGTIKLWDCGAAKELATLPGHLEETTGVAFSPDGRTLASVARGDGIKLWHLATLRELVSIDYPRAAAFVEFTPDGTRLAVTTLDNTLHFFEAPR
jgi:WD40 repeat protein